MSGTKKNPSVSIIVRCRNNWQTTLKALQSVIDNTPKDQYRLVVVDDGSIDVTAQGLLEFSGGKKNFIALKHEESKGAVSATNTGLKYVFENPTPYIMILDNDIEILESNTTWLSDLISYFEEDEAVGVVGASSDKVIGLQHVSQITSDQEPKFLISFAMMMSLKCAKKTGLWDTRFDPGNCEDLDITLRARRAGFKLKVAKDVFITHHCHQTFEGLGLKQLIETNEKKLLEKWGERIYHELKGG
jgi:GT2 family glycosyltransferase